MPESNLRLEEMRRLVIAALSDLGRHPDFDDLVQEALISAWQTAARFNREGYWPCCFSTMVTRQARWRAKEYLSTGWRKRAEASLEDIYSEWLADGTSASLEETVLLRLEVQSTLGLMRPRERDVIHRLFWLGETKREIAKAIGVHPSRVGQLLQQGLRRCRRTLKLVY